MQLQVIFDDTVIAAGRNLSTTFKGGQFIYFDAQLGDDLVLEIGVALLIKLPGINGELVKVWDNSEILNSDNLIPIPREISESNFDLYLGLGSSIDQPNFRAYVIYTEVSQETLSAQIDDLQADIDLILQNQTTSFNLQAAIGVNELAQNTALSILGTGLAPLTAGVSAGVIPVLTGSQLFFLLP
jgi:hypothetical protein